MDFVIVGIVIGAFLVGAGALLRDLGPRLRPRVSRPDAYELDQEKLAHAWTRFCQSLGMAATTLGFLIVIATVLGFFLNVRSGTGWAIVGVMTLLALAGTVASFVKISGHYRSGGFDPRERTELASPAFEPAPYTTEPATLIVADRTIPLGLNDPFAIPEPAPVDEAPAVAAEPEPDAEDPVAAPVSPEPTAAEEQAQQTFEEPAEAFRPAADFAVIEEAVEIDVPPVETEPKPVAAELELSGLPVADVAETIEPEPDYVPEVAFEGRVEPSWQPPEQLSPAQVPVLSGFEPPLIDPDEDLPAWGAPPVVERIAPLPVRPTPPSAVRRVFESSLLADLQPESTPAEDLAGPFQSRLLNELTAKRDEMEPSGNDVLIAETPAVDPSRGARSE